MTAISTIHWTGKSGNKYKYWIYPLDPFPSLKEEGGNYAFTKETSPGYWVPLYFGQTSDLSERFDNHHKIQKAINAGATHIHAHLNDDEDARLAEEADLIARWKPLCND